MANQYTNHVVVNGSAIIDLRSDTVTASQLKSGVTAHDKSGAPITGTLESDAFILEYKVNDGVFSFDSTYAEIKAAVLANKTFRFTSWGDDTIGAWYGDCYATNTTFQGVTFTECVRFWIELDTYKVSILYYGYSNGVLTQASQQWLCHPNGNKAITASTSTQTGIDVANYATVSVAPTPTESKTVTGNGTVTPTSGKHLSSVTVAIPTYDGTVS